MISNQIPVCIIGAGPGGATTSIFLSQKKIPHIIVDKDTFPRDKICGDGLDLKVLRVLKQLDPNITPETIFGNQPFSKSWGTRFIAPSGRYQDLVLKPKSEDEIAYPMFCTSKRFNFDQFLVEKLDKTYAEVHLGTKATKIERKNGGIEVTFEKEGKIYKTFCNLIVGADGDHSVVLRELDERKIDRKHYAAGLRQYWKNVSGIHEAKLIEIYFKKEYPLGYFWIFPLPNNEANVGFGMLSELVSEKKVNLQACMRDIIENDKVMAPRFKDATALEPMRGWGLPLASRRKKAFGDNYLLVGDAASAINPLTGEGIGTAMVSGVVAATFIKKAIDNQRFTEDVFKNYDRELYRRLEPEIKKFNRIMPLGFQHWMNPFIEFLLRIPLAQWYFNKFHKGWMNTALNKPIDVNVE
jgi:geranylgeranyl reductase family protein